MLQRPAGPKAVWVGVLPSQVPLPTDCSPGDLFEVLEFAQVCLSVHMAECSTAELQVFTLLSYTFCSLVRFADEVCFPRHS